MTETNIKTGRAILIGTAMMTILLQACSPLGIATGAGATAGVSAAQEGGISRAWTDARIQATINDLWFRYDVDMFRKIDMTVNQGRVLLTGVVQKPEHRVEAVRLAWQPDGVKQVINEIRVDKEEGFVSIARDTWITTRLRTAITLDRDNQSINYNIDTVQGVIYLLGAAQNQAELNRVIETARTIPDVKHVVSYVKILGRPVEQTSANTNEEAPPLNPDTTEVIQSPPDSEISQPVPVETETIDVQPLAPETQN